MVCQKKWFAKTSPNLLMMQTLVSVLHKLWQLMGANGVLILCLKWWKLILKSDLNYVLSSYNRTYANICHLRKISIFSIQATKTPLYSPTCQPLSSSNKLLIKHVSITFFVKNTKKNNIKRLDPPRKSYYYFITNKFKFHFLYRKNKWKRIHIFLIMLWC